MATSTYRPIASITLGSSASSVTFSSIPQTYRDFVVVGNGFSSTAAGVIGRFNGDSGTVYSSRQLFGDGESRQKTTTTSESETQFGRFDNTTIADFVTSVMDYSATDKHKTFLSRYGSSAVLVAALAGEYGSTSAITSLLLFPESGTFSPGSTFALYGIEA